MKTINKRAPKLLSRKNLTRFTYGTTDFQGWRLHITHKGSVFCRYFSDKTFGGGKESLKAAESMLEDVRHILKSAKLRDGKHTQATVRRVNAYLDTAKAA